MIKLANMNAMLILVALGIAFGNYLVKDRSERTAKRLAQIERAIAKEGIAMRTLDAEWSYLNEPSRLQKLAVRHLSLLQIKPSQIVDIHRLSDRLPLVVNAGVPGTEGDVPTASAPRSPSKPSLISPARATDLAALDDSR